jgi:hypothetical protein
MRHLTGTLLILIASSALAVTDRESIPAGRAALDRGDLDRAAAPDLKDVSEALKRVS